MSPRLSARVDFAKYNNGVKTLENFLPLPHGGVTRRPGTLFVAEVKDSSKKTRLIPFQFSITQAYIIEMGTLYMRVHTLNGQLTSTKTITGAADNGSGAIRITATGHGYSTGWTVTISGVVGTTEANGTWVIARITDDTFDLNGSTFTNPYTSGGSAVGIVEVATPFTEAQLFDVHYAQSADVLYLAHASHEPSKLSRTSAVAFSLADIVFIDGPYLAERTDLTITPSVTTGSGTLTASASLFTANHVGAFFRLKHGAAWGYAKVTGYTSATVVDMDVKQDFGGAAASDAFREGAWSAEQGFPRAVTFFEESLYWAGTTNNPQTFWGSKNGSFEEHTPGTNDNDAVSFTIASNQVNTILWLAPSRALIIGTAGGEFQAQGGIHIAHRILESRCDHLRG